MNDKELKQPSNETLNVDKYEMLKIDWKKFSYEVKTEEDIQQLLRIKQKLDFINQIYRTRTDLKDQIQAQTERHIQNIEHLSIPEGLKTFNSRLIANSSLFFRKINNTKSENEVAKELSKKLSKLNHSIAIRYVLLASYSAISFGAAFVSYKRYMYGNKLLFGLVYGVIGVIPSCLLWGIIKEQ
jgi:hypothetical protein